MATAWSVGRRENADDLVGAGGQTGEYADGQRSGAGVGQPHSSD
jgi:hypothetical protein